MEGLIFGPTDGVVTILITRARSYQIGWLMSPNAAAVYPVMTSRIKDPFPSLISAL